MKINLSRLHALRNGKRYNPVSYLFVAPHLAFFAVFILYPLFKGLLISLQSYDYLRPEAARFVGLENYQALFNSGTVRFNLFWNSLRNTVVFVACSVPLNIVIPLGLALLVNPRTAGRRFFRAIYFAPWVLSVTVISLTWWWIFQSQGGLLNYYLTELVGLKGPRWLSTVPWAWVSIITATTWWTAGLGLWSREVLQSTPET